LGISLGYTPGLLSRRVKWLTARKWLESKKVVANLAKGMHGNAQKVRITDLGQTKAQPIWRLYEKFAQRLLAGISESDLQTHYRINQIITEKLHASRFIVELTPSPNAGQPATEKAPRMPAVKKQIPAPASDTRKPIAISPPERSEEFLD
jgi:DNA-binding MarR family transcriptional regulator